MSNQNVSDRYFSINESKKVRFILDQNEIISLVEIHTNTFSMIKEYLNAKNRL